MNNTNNYEKITLKTLKEMFTLDNVKRPSNKSSNHAILTLIEMIDDSARVVECERSKGGTILNRGSTVECLVKLLINDQKSAKKYLAKRCDLINNGVKYEVKYSSSKGYAHYNPRQDLTNLIFVNQHGIYLTSGDHIILDKCGKHIKDIDYKGAKVLYTF